MGPAAGSERPGLPTRALARRAARGEQRAFAQIYESHHQEIYRYCLAILRNPSDAEDAMQSTMTAALRSLPGEQREIALRPWLFRIAHNESLSIVRLRRQSPAREELPEATGESLESTVERRGRLRALVSDLQALPDRQRGALVMRELSGLDYEQIGAALDCGGAAARQTVHEARLSLQHRGEGRRMECEPVREAISSRDGRRLRGRKLRAHLEGCEGCSDFKLAIAARRDDLEALCPPLPLAAAGALFAGLTGGGVAGGIGSGTGAGAATGLGMASGSGGALAGTTATGGVAAAITAKGAAVIAAAVIGAGTADATGLVDLPLRGGSSSEQGGGAPDPGQSPALTAPARPGNQESEANDRPGDGDQPGSSGKNKSSNGKGKASGKGKGSGQGRPADPGSQGKGGGNGSPGGGKPAKPVKPVKAPKPVKPPQPVKPPKPPQSQAGGNPSPGSQSGNNAGGQGKSATAPGAEKSQGKGKPAES